MSHYDDLSTVVMVVAPSHWLDHNANSPFLLRSAILPWGAVV